MVQAAGFTRRIARTATKAAEAAGRGDTVQTDQHLAKLTAAIQRQARVYEAPRPAEVPARPVQAPDPATRAGREDLLLADLLRHPEQAEALARTLPSDAFTDSQRREVYETILSQAVDGDPVDPVTVGWHMARDRYIEVALSGRGRPEHDGAEPDAVYLHRLATIESVPTYGALDIAGDLLREDLKAALMDRPLTIATTPLVVEVHPRLTHQTGGLDPTINPTTPTPTNGHRPTIKP